MNWHLQVCLLNKVPGDTDSAGPEITSQDPKLNAAVFLLIMNIILKEIGMLTS